MSERQPSSPLAELLEQEAVQAIPSDLDLWPEIARRLHLRQGARGSMEHDVIPVHAPRSLPASAPVEGLSPRDRVGRRPGELAGIAVALGLAAMALVLISFVANRPPATPEQPIFANGAPPPPVASQIRPDEPRLVSPGTPASDDATAATPWILPETIECTFELDVAPDLKEDAVVIPVYVRSSGRCDDTRHLRLAIVSVDGARAAVTGSPVTLPLAESGNERAAAVTLSWSNWCGASGRFRLETVSGGERHTLPLPDAPRCMDDTRPSALRVIANSGPGTPAASPRATPTT
jgi:hypothetical protein